MPPGTLPQLWQEVSSGDNTGESLRVVRAFLEAREVRPLSDDDEQAANHLYEWISAAALPSPVFAVTFDGTADISDETQQALDESRSISEHAIAVLVLLNQILPIHKAKSPSDPILALASFTSTEDPWTTADSFANATAALQVYSHATGSENEAALRSTLQQILKEKIRPLFTRTRNPAITGAGRRNFHPVPLARFDASILDDEARPWKGSDLYATAVLGWIMAQYPVTDQTYIEADFPFLVPTILALTDDTSLLFKTKGCHLLTQLLSPIRENKSDILRRTNLASVFEDAVTPCLLSLPTITPEDASLKLLGVAYTALRALFQTAYNPDTNNEAYTTRMTKILRANLISSFHHISSSTPTSISTTTSASFPYPRLSTFLTEQIAVWVSELRIHTTKYLQDLVPILYTTLSNPFGTAHPPLLVAAANATRAVVLNAHPRIWRWRGEILGGLCTCWLHVLEEEKEKKIDSLDELKRALQGAVFLLKYALQNPVSGADTSVDEEQRLAQESVDKEWRVLVDADAELGDLLYADVGSSGDEERS
ncbi:CCA tRNA nucleotidyltransferase mitochondrial [Penicillium riverlandense]|uniref:CCA tRNA nucleotidyltransferase mitochondrial n=1 Tax=Penicillium riverlandense TaxID=1903569 RepID=UPI0025492EA2|nr:CCA tRNA nucleotidyltransferase mitochondrial [Penicillium riverlandense]KAJ5811518.1 CCA tRNA nucleotidyltransferase mitochondrial [Penicillium riverlandense]